jgi:hypothetical protein
MSVNSIFYPMAALAGLTALVLAAGAASRFLAVGRGQVSEDFYRTFTGGERPEFEAKLSRHYNNLLELPVLFYVAGLLIFTTNLVDGTFVSLFWVYVAARAVHAIVHITYNRPAHRAAVFGIGFVVLVVIWVRFLLLLGSVGAAA